MLQVVKKYWILLFNILTHLVLMLFSCSGCWSNCSGHGSKLSKNLEKFKLFGRLRLDKD